MVLASGPDYLTDPPHTKFLTGSFLATHSYVILKELDTRRHEDDSISFHSLFRSEGSEEVRCNTVDDYSQIHPNSIAEAFDDLYYRTIRDLADPPA